MQETRIVLRNVGKYNPRSLAEFCALGGYLGLKKALTMSPRAIVDAIKESGLRGRGGAAFSTGIKWEMISGISADQKYVVCNADEGEPATNKDRVIIAGDPHSLVEGMVIAGYAVGANKGYIYLRYEYPYLFPVLEQVIADAKAAGFLGEHICGSDFSFELTVVSGGGAYVCGEETAMLESIEGKRGEPRYKPPYPSVFGLHEKPTLINNVETLVNVPAIVNNGAQWYASFGLNGAVGTKVFTLSGNLVNRCVCEYPKGTSLHTLIYELAAAAPTTERFWGFRPGALPGISSTVICWISP